MDYSQLMASQMINNDTGFENEDAFYEATGRDRFMHLRGLCRKLGKARKLITALDLSVAKIPSGLRNRSQKPTPV